MTRAAVGTRLHVVRACCLVGAVSASFLYVARPDLGLVALAIVILGGFGWGSLGSSVELVGVAVFLVAALGLPQWALGWQFDDEHNLAALLLPVLAVSGLVSFLLGRLLRLARASPR